MSDVANITPHPHGFPGGVVGELVDYILGEMRRSQPKFALCCAMSIVSFLSGNRYAIKGWGTRLNLYQIAVGYTGGGKDAVWSSFMDIINQVGYEGDAKESCTSGAALQTMLSENRNCHIFKDEIWEMLLSAKGNNANSHQRELVSVIMSLYSKGNGTYGGKAYAKKEDNIDPIKNPFLNFVGATTPVRFGEALSRSQIEDGFLNRLIIHRSEDVPETRMPNGARLTQETLSYLQNMSAHGDSEFPVEVVISEDAAAEFKKLSLKADQNLTDPDYGPLWSRAHENALRLAGVVAIGIDFLKPLIDITTARWACQMVDGQLTEFTALLEELMSDSKFDEEAKRAMKCIRGAESYKDLQYIEFFKLGLMPRGKLLKLMKMKAPDFEHLVTYLIDSDQVLVEYEGSIQVLMATEFNKRS